MKSRPIMTSLTVRAATTVLVAVLGLPAPSASQERPNQGTVSPVWPADDSRVDATMNRRGPQVALRSTSLWISLQETTDRVEVGRLTNEQVQAALDVEGLPAGWKITRGSSARKVVINGPPLTPGKVLRIPFITEQQSVRLTPVSGRPVLHRLCGTCAPARLSIGRLDDSLVSALVANKARRSPLEEGTYALLMVF